MLLIAYLFRCSHDVALWGGSLTNLIYVVWNWAIKKHKIVMGGQPYSPEKREILHFKRKVSSKSLLRNESLNLKTNVSISKAKSMGHN